MCPIEKVTLWEGLLRLTSKSETDNGVVGDNFFAITENQTRDPGVYASYAPRLSYQFINGNSSEYIVQELDNCRSLYGKAFVFALFLSYIHKNAELRYTGMHPRYHPCKTR